MCLLNCVQGNCDYSGFAKKKGSGGRCGAYSIDFSFFQIVRRHKIADATAYLLEMAGDVQGAFGIMLESLSNSIRNLSDSMEAEKGTDKAKGE